MAKVSDIQRNLKDLKDDVDKLRSHTVDLVAKVADVGKDTVDSTVDTSKNAVKTAAKTIQKNPVASLAGAVGVGVVLGGIVKKLFGKKRR